MKRGFLIFALLLNVAACTHAPVNWERTGNAAHDAALHPSVWAPLAGATVFAIEDLDNQVSNHLSDHAPVFGDSDSAGDASDQLKSLLMVTAAASAFVAPVPVGEDILSHGGEHLVVAMAGIEITRGLTERIKDMADRQRPNGENDKSFPSGHASQAFAAATFASANTHRAWGDSVAGQWVDAGLYTVASFTAYARVEAEKHHPSDVLVGTALGNFMARFLDRLLLEDDSKVSLSANYDGEAVIVGFQYGF